ncbi:hypothetical protein [Moraxella lacunata]|uniref:hypothetical protein n=1 Tax=Moraxella lacunata TaxID=477 RepID=UPI003EDECCB3
MVRLKRAMFWTGCKVGSLRLVMTRLYDFWSIRPSFNSSSKHQRKSTIRDNSFMTALFVINKCYCNMNYLALFRACLPFITLFRI